MIVSSTQNVPEVSAKPRHVAIIMDGNGRWATSRKLPRTAGHIRGVQAVRRAVELCARENIPYLTLFAFSSENWRRPEEEVSLLMKLFVKALQKEVVKLNKHNIRLKVVGDLEPFGDNLGKLIQEAEHLTHQNTGLTLTICANYGGRWDILQAMQQVIKTRLAKQVALDDVISENEITPFLSMSYAPEPDLFIRTGERFESQTF